MRKDGRPDTTQRKHRFTKMLQNAFLWAGYFTPERILREEGEGYAREGFF
jgi:hypothetical protein